MLNQKYIILPLSFAGRYTGDDADLQASIISQVLKTCDSQEEAEAFVRELANKGRALLVLPALEMPNSRLNYFLTHNKNTMNKSDIAELAYNVNRVYDHANGNTNMPAWADLPDPDKQENIKLVQFYLDNPAVSPAEVHKQWLNKMAVDGWGYGPNYDEFHKQHPMILEYVNLPVPQKFKYHLFPQVVNLAKKFLDVLPKLEPEPQIAGIPSVTIGQTGSAAATPPNLLDVKEKKDEVKAELSTPPPPPGNLIDMKEKSSSEPSADKPELSANLTETSQPVTPGPENKPPIDDGLVRGKGL